jgi:hypothetical protein
MPVIVMVLSLYEPVREVERGCCRANIGRFAAKALPVEQLQVEQ